MSLNVSFGANQPTTTTAAAAKNTMQLNPQAKTLEPAPHKKDEVSFTTKATNFAKSPAGIGTGVVLALTTAVCAFYPPATKVITGLFAKKAEEATKVTQKLLESSEAMAARHEAEAAKKALQAAK
ncbi:MAG: hypothetical protein WCK67_01725 [bacterium]